MWPLVRCLFDIGSGASGLVAAFGACESTREVVQAFMHFDDPRRVTVVVFMALFCGGAVEIGTLVWHGLQTLRAAKPTPHRMPSKRRTRVVRSRRPGGPRQPDK